MNNILLAAKEQEQLTNLQYFAVTFLQNHGLSLAPQKNSNSSWMRCRGSSTALAQEKGSSLGGLEKESWAQLSAPHHSAGFVATQLCSHPAHDENVPSQPKPLKIITKQSCACSQRCIWDDGLLTTRAKGQMNHITLHE